MLRLSLQHPAVVLPAPPTTATRLHGGYIPSLTQRQLFVPFLMICTISAKTNIAAIPTDLQKSLLQTVLSCNTHAAAHCRHHGAQSATT
eukprot:7375-Heterococcus_DN1.PRE.3